MNSYYNKYKALLQASIIIFDQYFLSVSYIELKDRGGKIHKSFRIIGNIKFMIQRNIIRDPAKIMTL